MEPSFLGLVVDSSIVIEAERKRLTVEDLMTAIRRRRRAFINELKKHVPVQPVTDETGELAGSISGSQAAKGIKVPVGSWAAQLKGARRTSQDIFRIESFGHQCLLGGRKYENCLVIRESDYLNHVVSLTTYVPNTGPIEFSFFDMNNLKVPETTMRIKSWRIASFDQR